jgi:hypothetical protein
LLSGIKHSNQDEHQDTPADDLKTRKTDSEDIAGFGSINHADRGVPVPDHKHDDYRRCDERDVEEQHGTKNQEQRDIVVTGSLSFDIFDLFPGPAGFKASGTEVFPIKVAITKRAHKPAAPDARQDCLLRRVIEAGGLSFHKDIFGGRCHNGSPKERGEQFYLHKAVAT